MSLVGSRMRRARAVRSSTSPVPVPCARGHRSRPMPRQGRASCAHRGLCLRIRPEGEGEHDLAGPFPDRRLQGLAEEHKANPTAALRRSGQPEENRDGRALSRIERIEFHHRIAGPGRWRNRMKMKAGVLTVCGAPRPFATSKPIHVVEVDLDPPARAKCWSRWAAAASAIPTCR